MFQKFKKYKLLFFLIVQSTFLQASSLSELSEYPHFCKEAASNDEIFAHFRKDNHCCGVVDTVSSTTGAEYLNFIILNDPQIASLFDKFRENDSIGDPFIYSFGDYGFFSPTTLRYIKVASDLRSMFADLDQMDIVEIGGGYGGQCKIINDLTGFKSYTIIDLPEAIALTKKYLKNFDIKNVIFIESKDLSQIKSYDLVISNYAFSEIDRSEQQNYLEEVINQTRNGYMTMNFITQHLRSISLEELARIIRWNFKIPKIEKENPSTHPGNVLITWSPI